MTAVLINLTRLSKYSKRLAEHPVTVLILA